MVELDALWGFDEAAAIREIDLLHSKDPVIIALSTLLIRSVLTGAVHGKRTAFSVSILYFFKGY